MKKLLRCHRMYCVPFQMQFQLRWCVARSLCHSFSSLASPPDDSGRPSFLFKSRGQRQLANKAQLLQRDRATLCWYFISTDTQLYDKLHFKHSKVTQDRSIGHYVTSESVLCIDVSVVYYRFRHTAACSVYVHIITIIKTTRLSVAEVDVAGWAWSTHA